MIAVFIKWSSRIQAITDATHGAETLWAIDSQPTLVWGKGNICLKIKSPLSENLKSNTR
jgi:hypothetical protein